MTPSGRGAEPLVVSEFGAWGLPNLSGFVGRDRAGAVVVRVRPGMGGWCRLRSRCGQNARLWHLDKVFGSWEALCDETQRRQFETLRYQIETMRSRPEIAGYVLTELTDVHWEANGLLDMAGHPRSFGDRVALVNQSPLVVAEFDRGCIWDGEQVSVAVTAVNDGHDREHSHLRCGRTESDTVDDGATCPLPAHGHSARTEFEFTATCDEQPRLASIECSLVTDGAPAATTNRQVLVIPRTRPQMSTDMSISTVDERLADRLTELGYDVTDGDAELRVLRRLRPEDHDHIEHGGRALLLADDVDAFGQGFGEFPKFELRKWRDALFGGGEWVSAFSWLRRVGRFSKLPGGPMMDSFFETVAPSVVISGVPPARYEHDVLAGVFVGWVSARSLRSSRGITLGSGACWSLRCD